ncbi:hypothetical protein ACOSP7_006288 [Xanthoceras sorbifolium]
MTEYVTCEEFNKNLEEKFAKHNLELNTKFDMILKKLEELKPTNTHPPIHETQNTDSSATHTVQKIPIDIDESETQHDKTLPNEVRGVITNKPNEFMDVPDDAQLKMVAYKLKGGAAAWWENLCEERTNAQKPPIVT